MAIWGRLSILSDLHIVDLGLADNSLRETNMFFQQLPAQPPGTMWGFDCLSVPGLGI